ncbi:MAG: DUF1329 domain-containing protein [Deltaproteobacteria bacterium]|nr:DUF1329 domain-containing protein [Deltaproteobacteria bacterium]
MHKKTLKFWTLLMAALIISSFLGASLSFSQEMPKPGEKIDKSNYKKYAHLFPEEWARAFEDGWGIMSPIHMNVTATKPAPEPKAFLDLSAKNKGKFGLDAEGNVTGGWAYDGFPFPDLDRNDKNFAIKYMWNFQARYIWDDTHENGVSFERRRGEDVRYNMLEQIWVYFKNRISCNPKPVMPNPNGLFRAQLLHFKKPDSIKNTMNLSYRHADPKKPDETYIYLPSMRRVLRAEAGQRSTPLLGSTQALDDFNGFDGNTNEFTYTIVKEQKVLAIMRGVKLTMNEAMGWNKKDVPFPYDGYEIRDAYVIDIKPKDPRYPQSKKRIWIDKEARNALYTIAWDRAGKVWKLWQEAYKVLPVGNDTFLAVNGVFGLDVQFGLVTYFLSDSEINTCRYDYNDVTPQALLKRAR